MRGGKNSKPASGEGKYARRGAAIFSGTSGSPVAAVRRGVGRYSGQTTSSASTDALTHTKNAALLRLRLRVPVEHRGVPRRHGRAARATISGHAPLGVPLLVGY